LQSEIDLKKSGSFLVPLGLSVFFRVSPGGKGDFPDTYVVPGGRGASAAKTAEAVAPIKQKFMAVAVRKPRLVLWICESDKLPDVSSVKVASRDE